MAILVEATEKFILILIGYATRRVSFVFRASTGSICCSWVYLTPLGNGQR